MNAFENTSCYGRFARVAVEIKGVFFSGALCFTGLYTRITEIISNFRFLNFSLAEQERFRALAGGLKTGLVPRLLFTQFKTILRACSHDLFRVRFRER